MTTIRLRTKVEGETLKLPELKSLVGKTVDIEVTERPDDPTYPAARAAVDELERDAAAVGMTTEEYLALQADLDANPLRVPGLTPAGVRSVTFVPGGRVRPLPLPDLDD